MAASVLEFDTISVVKVSITNSADAEVDVRGGPTTVYGMFVTTAATAVWVKLYDDLDPTEGTTAPDHSFPIAANGEQFIPLGPPEGIPFANGCSVAVHAAGGTAAAAVNSATVVHLLTAA